MERNYTDKAYSRLYNQIRDINKSTISPITDEIGDILMKTIKSVDIINIDTMGVKSYQKTLLDMNDITISELKKIFADVENVDIASSKRIDTVTKRCSEYLKKLIFLSEQLGSNLTICSANSLKKMCGQYNANLTSYDKQLDDEYENVLKAETAEVAVKGLKKAVGAIVSAGVTIAAMPVKWAGALYVSGPRGMGEEIVSDTWGLINNVYDTGSGLASAAGSGIVYLFVKNTWTSTSASEEEMDEVEKMLSGKGLTGALEAEDYPQSIIAISKGMDTTMELVGLKNKIKNFAKDPEIEKAEEAFDKLKKWSEFKNEKELASKFKTIYEIGSAGYGFLEGKDARDVVEDGIVTGLKTVGSKVKSLSESKETLEKYFNKTK